MAVHLQSVPELCRFKMEEEEEDDDDSLVLPIQIPTITKQVTELAVWSGEPDTPSHYVKLAVDASPGCGGIAWPAGCVRASVHLSLMPALRGSLV